MTENLNSHMIADCDVIRRGEKDYINVTSVHTTVNFDDYSWQFESDSVMPFFTKAIQRTVNAHWQLIFVDLKPQLEIIVGDIIKSVMTPIFDKFAIQDFFQC